MEITKSQVTKVYSALIGFQAQEKEVQAKMIEDKNFTGACSLKFKNIISKNKTLIQPEITALEETQKSLQELVSEYNKEVDKLSQDSGGMKDARTGLWTFPTDKFAGFQDKLSSVKENHKETLEAFEKADKEFADILKEKIDVKFVSTKLDDCPVWVYSDTVSTLLEFGILTE